MLTRVQGKPPRLLLRLFTMTKQLFKYRCWKPVSKRTKDNACQEVNFTEQLLLDHAFYCQKPRSFDDPHDSHTGAVPTGSVHDIDRYAGENMGQVGYAMKAHRLTSLTQLAASKMPEVTTALVNLVGQKARREQFALSFSGVGDDDLMWTFYADEHRGICLEFDGNHPAFAQAWQVQYSVSPPVQAADTHDELMFHKAQSWAFQQEWRILFHAPDFPFPTESLRRVILGYRFPETAFAQLTDTLARGGYRVVIDQMQRRTDSYALVPVRRGVIGPQ